MILLITQQEAIDLSFVESKNFNTTKIKDSMIYSTQYRWIKPVLGDRLYKSLLDEVSNNSLGDANEMLLNDFIKPCLAYYIKYEAMPDLMLSLTNRGGQKGISDYSETTSKAERGEKREAAKQHADTFRTILVDFLNEHKADYPNYSISESKGKKSIRGGILLKRNRDRRKDKGVSYINTANKQTYDYQADENGFFLHDYSDIKAVGENVTIEIKNVANVVINESDYDVNFITEHQWVEVYINTGNENDYTGKITVTVNK